MSGNSKEQSNLRDHWAAHSASFFYDLFGPAGASADNQLRETP